MAVNVRLKRTEIGYIFDHSMARKWFSEPSLGPQAEQSGAVCPIVTELPQLKRARVSLGMPLVDSDRLQLFSTPRNAPRTSKA